ncbi:osteoclast stimulatory transmembrane protein isoform X2 [Ovis aries]|uniref:osteoclast stimulatory transmembrane protein isoform X2 n=1 Tax=Ovis aries TaxID=9940 RepID=UPI001C2E0AE1|nr:osteoclast stimulatory transmembrane protein isoform X2 [Ovis aries]
MRPPRGTLEHLIRTRWRYWYLGLRKALALLQATWIAYSKPIPASCGQLLTQVLLCGALALAAASLTYCWLASSLLYPLRPSAVVATVCGLLAFLGLVLVPPARCLFALSVPTLGTEQGRRLLLSWSTATLTVAVVPNVLANLRAAGQVLRCVTEGSLESLLNTTHWLQTGSQALGPDGQAGSQGLTLQAQGDSAAAFRLHVLRVTQQVLEDFSSLESSARVVALGTQRVVTGLFMLGLLLDSAWYLHCYLTDLRFDNIYATRQLTQRLAEVGATHLTASPPAWLLWAARPRLSQAELLSCLVRLGLFTLLLLAMAVTVALDHVAFLLAQAAVGWARELPAVPVTLTIKYDPPPENPYLSAHNSFQWELRFTAPGCPLLPAQRPHTAALLAAGALQLVACSTVLLETYARRLRHSIAASFFRTQEARRVRHLHARLQRRYDRHRGQPAQPQDASSCS